MAVMSASQDHRLRRRVSCGNGRDQVGETCGVNRLVGGAQFGQGPPAVLADAVGLRRTGRVDVGYGEAGEVVQLHPPDFAPADQMLLGALRELGPELDRLLVDAKLFTQLTEGCRGVVLPQKPPPCPATPR